MNPVVVTLKSFPDHAGIPGHQGGSLPRDTGDHATFDPSPNQKYTGYKEVTTGIKAIAKTYGKIIIDSRIWSGSIFGGIHMEFDITSLGDKAPDFRHKVNTYCQENGIFNRSWREEDVSKDRNKTSEQWVPGLVLDISHNSKLPDVPFNIFRSAATTLKQHDTAIVCFDMSKDEFGKANKEPDPHVTLLFLGPVDTLDKTAVIKKLTDFASTHAPIVGKFAGFAVFPKSIENDNKAPVVTLIDSRALPAFRQALVRLLDYPEETHGFTAHMTIGYTDKTVVEMPTDDKAYEKSFDSISLWFGDEHIDFPLTGTIIEKQAVLVKLKSFPDHKGRPGEQGGSLPKGSFETNPSFVKNPTFNPPPDHILVMHMTKPKNVSSILQNGLVPGSNPKGSTWNTVSDSDNIWFWRDVESDPKFSTWSSKTEAVIVAAVPSNVWKDPEGSHASMYKGSIPPEWIYGTIVNKKPIVVKLGKY